MKKQTRFAPAKINLMLAITGTRADGFHELISLVAPISLGDTLSAEYGENAPADTLSCAMQGVPVDATNLVMRATKLFREIVPALPPIHWRLEKRVPHGAGLGGGSSDAASALLLMNEICAGALGGKILRELAVQLGSDCALFLDEKPVIMRGRGEQTYTLSEREISALREREFLLFKPAFGVSTAEAYAKMKRAAPRFYGSQSDAESRLAAWQKNPTGTLPLFNSMELPVFEKYVALPALFALLRDRHALQAHMSGSGSACFAEISPSTNVPEIKRTIRDAWGETAFIEKITIR